MNAHRQCHPENTKWKILQKPAADSAGAHCQGSLIVYTTPAHVEAPVLAAGRITTAGDARQLQQSLKVVF
ncbi:MAG: hypothetical protein DMF92_07690 [Acidobacteria bacterium]|nr:MAG: hypothetical protein DMF92_07690 [Acidobacteriota bacterium]